MKNIVLFLIALSTVLMSACQKTWQDHYRDLEETEVVSPLNVLDYLETQTQYSAFVAKLKEYGLDKELERDHTLTVWAVSNEKMMALSSMDFDEEYILRYHINSLVFDKTKLKTGLRLMTFNGKYLSVEVNGDQVHVGDGTIIKGNQLCKNGVVHEIDQLLSPDISIYDYIENLGDSHSIIRDTILAMNDTIFDLANSIPIGVDSKGNTVYDSVFSITNPIFLRSNIMSEFAQVTMFLPSNEVIEDCFANLGELYGQFGKAFLRADSLIAYTWIKEAIFYNKVIENYGTEDLTSAFSRLWKPDIQQADPDYMRMSNGRIYNITKLKIPNNVHISMIKQLFHYWESVPDDIKPSLFTTTDITSIVPTVTDNVNFPALGITGYPYRYLLIQGDAAEASVPSLDFTAIMLEQDATGATTYKVVEVPAGEYNLYMGFRASGHPYLNIYFNDVLVRSGLNVSQSNPWNYDRNTNTTPGVSNHNGWGGLVGTVNVEGEGMNSFRIKIEYSSGTKTLRPYHWTLVPTANNY
ncbi:fasciclin domain-containing protein [Sphingobacterium olei]|uniref:Fasciclin domain-containing protein n=1 Tax=Sphingobacterium olei TaxID=2571155 RepID=A0A4U0P218_9SPHI|nr:fasciclin domain-containing protein [Sphingobacterium olei]TJZ61130.1 fasciclin domain-containing protein [Sphingobacterium olei]